METTTFTTPSGYAVVLNTYMEYGQTLLLQELATSEVSMDVSAEGTQGRKMHMTTNIYAVQEKALEFMVVSMADPTGVDVPNPVQAIMKMRAVDAVAIKQKIDELTQEPEDPKAASTTSSSSPSSSTTAAQPLPTSD